MADFGPVVGTGGMYKLMSGGLRLSMLRGHARRPAANHVRRLAAIHVQLLAANDVRRLAAIHVQRPAANRVLLPAAGLCRRRSGLRGRSAVGGSAVGWRSAAVCRRQSAVGRWRNVDCSPMVMIFYLANSHMFMVGSRSAWLPAAEKSSWAKLQHLPEILDKRCLSGWRQLDTDIMILRGARLPSQARPGRARQASLSIPGHGHGNLGHGMT